MDSTPTAVPANASGQPSIENSPRSTAQPSRPIHHQAGRSSRPAVVAQVVTAIVKPAIPTGSSSRCQARSFQVVGSAKTARRRAHTDPCVHDR